MQTDLRAVWKNKSWYANLLSLHRITTQYLLALYHWLSGGEITASVLQQPCKCQTEDLVKILCLASLNLLHAHKSQSTAPPRPACTYLVRMAAAVRRYLTTRSHAEIWLQYSILLIYALNIHPVTDYFIPECLNYDWI